MPPMGLIDMTEGPVYTDVDFSEMNDETLVGAWRLLDKGRQYEGIEEDKARCAREMAWRLEKHGD